LATRYYAAPRVAAEGIVPALVSVARVELFGGLVGGPPLAGVGRGEAGVALHSPINQPEE